MGLKQDIGGARDGLADLSRRLDGINIPRDHAPASGDRAAPAGTESRLGKLEGAVRRLKGKMEEPVHLELD